jgi:exopolysaccharide biosynthesis polyprenyl glycosylphosphotransferase
MQADATVAPAAPLAPETPAQLAAAPSRVAAGRARWMRSCLAVDAATLTATVIASTVDIRGGSLHWWFSPWTCVFALLTVSLFQIRGLYQRRLRPSVLDDLRRLAGAISVAAMTVLTARLLVEPLAASELVRPWAFALVYVVGGRAALYWSHGKARAAGEALSPTLVVGGGRVGRVVARRLLAQPALGLRPVGILDGDALEGEALDVPVLGGFDTLESAVALHGVERVIVTFANERDDVMLALANRAEAAGAAVSIVPRLFEKMPERVTVDHLGGLPLLTPHASDPRGLEVAIKYALDRVVGAALVLLAAPALLATALAVYLSMGRPIFFRQVRVGRDGVPFEILKFRSMKLPTREELEAQARAIAEGLPGGVEGVDRRTKVGVFIRRTSLDELPQLLNVLRGEMSIVGPRPERPEFVSRFESSVYRYTDRHRVKAGITGWAQVHGLRGKTSIDDRAEWDNWYVENFSPWLDVKILLMTAAAIFSAFRDVE